MKIFFGIILFIISFNLLKSEDTFWDYSPGPSNGGDFYGYTVNKNNNYIYIGSIKGVFRSKNNGDNWECVLKYYNSDICCLPDGKVLATCGNYNGIGGYWRKLFLSEDDGNNWNEIQGIEAYFYVTLDEEGIIYMRETDEYDKTIYKFKISIDMCKSWIITDSLLDLTGYEYIRKMQVYNGGTVALPCQKNKSDSGFLILSRDYGKTWEIKEFSSKINTIYFQSKDIWFLPCERGFYKSTDGGKNWKLFNLGFNVYSIIYIKEKDLYIAGSDIGIIKSNDIENSWSSDIEGFDEFKIRKANTTLFSDNSGNLFTRRNSIGIFRSSNSGLNWTEKDDGFTSNVLVNIIFGNSGYAATQGIFNTENTWYDWKNIGFRDLRFYGLTFNKYNNIFFGSYEIGDKNNDYRGVFRSTDEGRTWQQFNKGFSEMSVIELLLVDKDDNIYANSTGYIYRSIDNGESWKFKNFGYVFGINTASELFLLDDSPYPATVNYGRIRKSTDKGETWDSVSYIYFGPTLHQYKKNHLIFNPRTQTAITPTTPNARITYDNGNTWRDYKTTINGEERTAITVEAVDSMGNFLAFDNYMPCRSTDNGKTWERMDTTGLMHNRFTLFTVDPKGYIYLVAEYGGIYRSRQPFVSVPEPMQPAEDTTLRCRPNPSSCDVTIDYEVERRGHVRLLVTDLLGRQVALLADEEKEAGRYEAKLNNTNLNNGIYFCILTVNGIKYVNKIYYIK